MVIRMPYGRLGLRLDVPHSHFSLHIHVTLHLMSRTLQCHVQSGVLHAKIYDLGCVLGSILTETLKQ